MVIPQLPVSCVIAFYNFHVESFVVFCLLLILTLPMWTMLNYSLPWARYRQNQSFRAKLACLVSQIIISRLIANHVTCFSVKTQVMYAIFLSWIKVFLRKSIGFVYLIYTHRCSEKLGVVGGTKLCLRSIMFFFYYYVHLQSSAETSTDSSCSGNTAVVSCVSPTVPSSATWNEYVIIHHNAEKIPNSAQKFSIYWSYC